MKQLMCINAILVLCVIFSQSISANEENTKLIDSYNVIEKEIVKKEYDSITEYYAYPVTIRLLNLKKVTLANILPVYTKNRGWVRSQFLRNGDEVLLLERGKVAYSPIIYTSIKKEMYSFQTYVNVHDTHTYFKDGVLVHNYNTESDMGGVDWKPKPSTSSNSSGKKNNSSNGSSTGTSNTNKTPTKEELAILEAYKAQLIAASVGNQFDVSKKKLYERKKSSESQQDVSVEVLNTTNSVQVGDPVLATTGVFILEDVDAIVHGTLSSVAINRYYSTSSNITQSLGLGWASILDSRIIRGTETELKDTLDSLYANMQKLKELKNSLTSLSAYGEVRSTMNNIQLQYNEIHTMYSELLKEEEVRKAVHVLNQYVVNTRTPEYYYNIGMQFLTFIDEQGNAILFEYRGDGLWVPVDNVKAQYMKIMSRDGKDVTTENGFILFEKKGREIWFDKWGLIEKKRDKNGNEILFVRENDSKKLLEIISPEGKSIHFEYNNKGFLTTLSIPGGKKVEYAYVGNTLSSVTDSSGDKSLFEYNGEDLLSRFIKPDGSYVSFEYGERDASGQFLTTSTTNEEGYTEYFEYDLKNNLTIYTDYSGFKKYIYYDDMHRTTKEIDKNGFTTQFTYDSLGNISSMVVNGNVTRYQYDSRGNKTHAYYSDGSKKEWIYSNIDQVIHYRDRDGKTWNLTYDENGNAIEFSQGGKVAQRIQYSPQGAITQIVDPEGNTTTFTYDSNYNIVKKTTGTITELFEYDDSGNIILHIDGEQRRWIYEHGLHQITQITPMSLKRIFTLNTRKDVVSMREIDLLTNEERFFEYTYDRRRLLQSIHQNEKILVAYTYYPAGELKSITYGEEGSDVWLTEYELLSGGSYSIHKKKFDEHGVQLGETYTETVKIENGGKKLTHTLSGNIETELNYDAWGRLTSVVNGENEILQRVLSSEGRTLKQQSSFGGWYESEYNAQGFLSYSSEQNKNGIALSYTDSGKVESKVDQTGNITVYTYNSQGLIAQEKTEKGSIFYTYDGVGRLSQILVGKTNNIQTCEEYTNIEYSQDSRTVSIDYGGVYSEVFILNAWGDILQKIDGEKNRYINEYNMLGQVEVSYDAYGNKTMYEYNALGFLSKIIFADKSEITYTYTNVEKLESITDALGIQWKGTFDDAGNLISEIGRSLVERNYEYDSVGRIISLSVGGKIVGTYAYSDYGKSMIYTDANNNDYSYTIDGYGRLVAEKNRLGISQFYSYNDAGDLIKKVDFNKGVHTIAYDEKNNIQELLYSDNKKSQLTYTIAGRILEAQNETGVISYTYNKAGLLESQTDHAVSETTRYFYDKAGRRERYSSVNRDVLYTYGKNGELLNVTDKLQDLSVSFEYDMLMREVSREFANGIIQKTHYDTVGRIILISEIQANGNIIRSEGYIYNTLGQIYLKIDETALVTKYAYDEQGRLHTVLYPYAPEKVAFDKQEASEAGLFLTDDMGYADVLYLTSSEVRDAEKLLNKISYGRANMLRSMQTVWKESFTYDENSNRLSKATSWGTINYTYDKENRLIHSGLNGSGTTFSYDANGNLLVKSNAYKKDQFQYNGINRMSLSISSDSIMQTTAVTNYAYDALGRRNMLQNEGFSTIRTLYDGFSHDIIKEAEVFLSGAFSSNFISQERKQQLIESASERYLFVEDIQRDDSLQRYNNVDSQFSGVKMALYAKGEIIGITYADTSNYKNLYFGTDHLGSVRTVSQNYGHVENRYEYDAFGNPVKGEHNAGVSYGYTGKQYNATTGLYNYGYRDYASQYARFTTMDPIRDGNNWFSYVVNDPINFIDKLGLLTVYFVTDAKQQHFPSMIITNEAGVEVQVPIFLGNSSTVSIPAQGCYLVCVSNATFALSDEGKTVLELNEEKSNFLPATAAEPQSVNVHAFAKNNNLVFDYWTRRVQKNLSTKINELNASDTEYAVLAQLPYNSAGSTHWVTITGGTVDRESPDTGLIQSYVKVLGSSVNDTNAAFRPASWAVDGNYVYVPVAEIIKIHTYNVKPELIEDDKNN